jgi:hypothetical protein
MDLDQIIEVERLKLKSDAYQMSIGELANLYASGELTIDPDFQREFRWSYSQKVTFVESVLLQFPLPSIFVASRPTGTWDVLDGLQRLSTLFEFMGILKDSDGNAVLPMSLTSTERLTDLEGVFFSPDFGEPALSEGNQRDFKRHRMDIKIILRQSDDEMLYELFTRLNTGGTQLTSQDIRNALINKRERAFRAYLDRLVQHERFRKATALSDLDVNLRYDYELLLIFLLTVNEEDDALDAIKDLDETLTSLAKRSSQLYEWDRSESERIFDRVFRLLGENAFEPPSPSGTRGAGLNRDAFVAITSVCATAVKRKRTEDTKAAIESYWRVEDRPATFAALVRWGRQCFD